MGGLGIVVSILLIAVQTVAAQDTDCERRWPNAFCTSMFNNRCPEGSTYSYNYCGYQKICCIPRSSHVPTESPCGKRMVTRRPNDDGATRILGGSRSYTGEWPWQVSLQYYGGHICGGTIIDRHWILTAAHCFDEARTVGAWRVVTGEYDRRTYSDRETSYLVSNVYRHRLYDKEAIVYDIALMRVRTPIEYNSYVQPACLPDAGDDYTNNMCTVTGWGAHTFKGPAVDRLEKVTLPVISNRVCAYKYRNSRILANHICVGHTRSGVGSCQGDSGGPLNCQRNGVWNVVGITSFAISCGTSYFPDVFTRVSEMLGWIRSYVQTS